jgi:hypothetical protein
MIVHLLWQVPIGQKRDKRIIDAVEPPSIQRPECVKCSHQVGPDHRPSHLKKYGHETIWGGRLV